MLCRKRKANFTKQELEVLVVNVQARKDILFTKRNDPVSNQAKQNAWESIAHKVNNVDTVGGEHRTVNDVRRKWVCFLSETKKAEQQRRRRMAVAGTGSSVARNSSSFGASSDYTPNLIENILNICKTIDKKQGRPSVGRPSTRLSSEDGNDLSMSSSSANAGAGFVSSDMNSNIAIKNDNTDSDTDTKFLQVASVYSQNEQIEGVGIHMKNSCQESVNSPTMSNQGANIIANIKSLSQQTANISGNSARSGTDNNSAVTDMTGPTLYTMLNMNGGDVIQNLPTINSNIKIVRITPNITSDIHTNNIVDLNKDEGAGVTLQGATIRSLRRSKRGHSQQGGNNDKGCQASLETDEELSEGAEGNMDDGDEVAAGIAPSTDQIEWNVVPSYTNSTHINDSGNEADRKPPTDHQSDHTTISGTESDDEQQGQPKRRKFQDYLEKLYWVEESRLKIEERRLAIEEERLAIERERLELEKETAKTNQQNSALTSQSRASTRTSK